MRNLFKFPIFLLAAACFAAPAIAQTYPERPISLIVAASPGGNLDLTSRVMAEKMTQILGQTVVVENRPGASGATAAQAIAKAQPDGYTIGGIANTFTIVPSVLKDAGYDPIKQYVGIGLMNKVPLAVVVSNAIPANTMEELITLLKDKPGEYAYASGGIGSSTHIPAALLVLRTGIEVTHVPYRGGNAPAYPDLLAGRVGFIFDPITTAPKLVESGQVKVLAVSTTERVASMPDVPTISETIVPDYDAALWTGLVAPAGVPAEIIERLHQAYLEAINDPAVQERISRGGVVLDPSETAEGFTAYIAEETARFAALVEEACIESEE